ncbi:MAG: hypothetical protein JWQ27_2262 [Ferruginibacter sp.]|nr:hypothetical protein [Ferruginibacter sp.]
MFALKPLLISVCSAFSLAAVAQDAVPGHLAADTFFVHGNRRHPGKTSTQFLLPAAMLGYGFAAIRNHGFLQINEEFEEELVTEHPHGAIHADNYLQFGPAATVYLLGFSGIKGYHNLRDKSAIFLLSNLFLNASSQLIKNAAGEMRPDGSASSSFPSGHTAEAFAGAEFLRLEYKAVSPWYGIAGYAMAATTGYLRMYNNKHWFNDVVAGAGLGIAATRLSWWLYPLIQRKLSHAHLKQTALMPRYANHQPQLALLHQF